MLESHARWRMVLAVAGVVGCAGGESSDFGGQYVPCAAIKQPLTPELAAQHRLDEVRAQLEGPVQQTLRWTANPELEIDPMDLESFSGPPSGYQEVTQVTGSVSLGEPSFREGYNSSTGMGGCPSWVELPATVSLATADGAVSLTAEGTLRVYDPADPDWGTNVPEVSATAPLNPLNGSLRLQRRPGVEEPAEVQVHLYVFAEGVRGSIEPSVNQEVALTGVWPDDGCSVGEVPLEAETAYPLLGDKSFAELQAEWHSAIASAPKASAHRLDGSMVDVWVEPGPPVGTACFQALDPRRPAVRFHTDSRLLTSDGLVNAPLADGWLELETYALYSPNGRRWSSSGMLDPAEFADRTGIAGIDALDSPWLSADYTVEFTRSASGIDQSGLLRVLGLPRCVAPGGHCAVDPSKHGSAIECLYWPWPPIDTVDEFCGRHLQ